MTSTETNAGERAYNEAAARFKDLHGSDYAALYAECAERQRTIRAEADAGRFWSESADTERWFYDKAIMRLQVLDRAAHEAGMRALAAGEVK